VAKSPEAFRTISEVADALEVPQHVLRFWETKFSQVKPMKRGGGRRYYRPEDVDLLRQIRRLLYHEGYTIKGVQKVLRDNAAKSTTPPPVAAKAHSATAPVDGDGKTKLRGLLTELSSINDDLRKLAGDS
jgi:DNA-binding transcriptional MerR regulator